MGNEAWLDAFAEDILGAITEAPDRPRTRAE
jgi:hypothetical protein